MTSSAKHKNLAMVVVTMLTAATATALLSIGMTAQADAQRLIVRPIFQDTYRVKFIQVKVLNDHEGFLSGDGEFKMFAGANGKQIFLDTCTPPAGKSDCDGAMNDVSPGEVVKFPASKYVDINIRPGGAINVGAYGIEEDWEGWTPPALPSWVDTACKPIPGAHYVCDYWPQISRVASWLGAHLNSNEKLGVVNAAYATSNYPTGNISIRSSTGDYILTFSIQKIGGIAPPLAR
jgi:hypothetical protein